MISFRSLLKFNKKVLKLFWKKKNLLMNASPNLMLENQVLINNLF